MSGCVARSYRSGELNLNGWEWGAPNGRPSLILLHGGLEHGRVWDGIAAHFANDWHVVAPDLRGHGDSDWAVGGDYPIMGFVADLAALFAAGLAERAILVGHSLGGAVACHFAALYPEKVAGLCVIEGLRPADKQEPADVAAQISALRGWADKQAGETRAKRVYPSLAAGGERIAANDPRMPPGLARELAEKGMRPIEGGYVWKYDDRVRLPSILDDLTPDPAEFWQRISCPVQLVYGAESWARSPADDGRMGHFRDARLATVPGAGHNVHHHRPEAFREILGAFLDEI